jgi:hypothetical protein
MNHGHLDYPRCWKLGAGRGQPAFLYVPDWEIDANTDCVYVTPYPVVI